MKMTERHFHQMERQANFLGTNRTNISFLKIYLNRHRQLTEQEINTALKEVYDNEKQKETYITRFPDVYFDILKDKNLYLNTINAYLSALMYWEMESSNDWKEEETKNKHMNRVYHIDTELLNQFVSFSKKTTINQNTLINYAVGYDYHLKTTRGVAEGNQGKTRKALELTHLTANKLNEFPTQEKIKKINQIIGDIPSIL